MHELQTRVPRDGWQRLAAGEGTGTHSENPCTHGNRVGASQNHALVIQELLDPPRRGSDRDRNVRSRLVRARARHYCYRAWGAKGPEGADSRNAQ
jgi:hypothetical protein